MYKYFCSPHQHLLCRNAERSSPLQGHEDRNLVADGNKKLSLQPPTPRKRTCLELYKHLTCNMNDTK